MKFPTKFPSLLQIVGVSIPGARLQTVPEAGHFAMEDRPEYTAAALDWFFSEERG